MPYVGWHTGLVIAVAGVDGWVHSCRSLWPDVAPHSLHSPANDGRLNSRRYSLEQRNSAPHSTYVCLFSDFVSVHAVEGKRLDKLTRSDREGAAAPEVKQDTTEERQTAEARNRNHDIRLYASNPSAQNPSTSHDHVFERGTDNDG